MGNLIGGKAMTFTTVNAAGTPQPDEDAWRMAMVRIEEAGDDVEQAFDAGEAAMAMPAPDLEALRWKLTRIFEPDDFEPEFTPSWRREYLAQTFADIDRLLAAR